MYSPNIKIQSLVVRATTADAAVSVRLTLFVWQRIPTVGACTYITGMRYSRHRCLFELQLIIGNFIRGPPDRRILKNPMSLNTMAERKCHRSHCSATSPSFGSSSTLSPTSHMLRPASPQYNSPTSPTWSPTSPSYSPTSPSQFNSPTSPTWSPTSPSYSPMSVAQFSSLAPPSYSPTPPILHGAGATASGKDGVVSRS